MGTLENEKSIDVFLARVSIHLTQNSLYESLSADKNGPITGTSFNYETIMTTDGSNRVVEPLISF